ncbi:unnamed protein product, partial [Dibothriocephalus latus]
MGRRSAGPMVSNRSAPLFSPGRRSSSSSGRSYLHSSSLPLCYRQHASPSGSQSPFFGSSGQLSWCAQSILSLAMDSDAELSDSSTTSTTSRSSSHQSVNLLTPKPSMIQKPLPSSPSPSSNRNQPEGESGEDAGATVDRGKQPGQDESARSSVASVDEKALDSQLLAVQKMIRRQA